MNYAKDKHIARERIDDQLNELISPPTKKWGGKGGQGSCNIWLLAYAVLLFAYRDKPYKICNRNNYAV